jgi:hypothetical protein
MKDRLKEVFDYLRTKGVVRTQKDFAGLVGIGANNLSSALKGDARYLTDGLARKVVSATGGEVSLGWMLTGEGEMLRDTRGNKIPLYDDVDSIGGHNDMVANVDDNARVTEWIDAGDWFPMATSAIHHYGDSMIEYPSGCVLVLKRVNDPRLLINGENYVIETDEFRVTKQIQDDGDCIVAYSTNRETYPDGRLIHAPFLIPKEAIRHLDLVLGCVIRKFSTPVRIK